MKGKILKALTFLLVLVLSATALVACAKPASAKAEVLAKTDTTVVIRVTEVTGAAHLIDAMNYLKGENELTFEMSGDLIVSIEGKDCDTVTWSPFWFLYTSDAEMTNTEWGTVTYLDNVYGSAILGATELEVVVGELYIWEYK